MFGSSREDERGVSLLMVLLLGISPLLLFAMIHLWIGERTALLVAALLSILLVVYERLRDHPVKGYSIWLVVVFSAQFCASLFFRNQSDGTQVEVIAEGGIFILALFSLLRRRPFTLDFDGYLTRYSHDGRVSLIRAHYFTTALWGLAMLTLMVGHVGKGWVPEFAIALALPVLILCVGSAFILARST